MKMLVKFIAVGCKKSIANNESYIMEIYKSINSARMIKSLNLTPDEVTFGADPLRPIDDEDNVFLLQFNSEDDGKADISDLSELMTLKRYCWKPSFDGKISGMLNGVQTYNDGIVREQLLKQREIEVDLRGEQFSKYFLDDFIERYCALARDRNHIMHNKLLDRSVYVSIKVSAERIQEDLVKAFEKLHNIILSKEEKFEVEKQR